MRTREAGFLRILKLDSGAVPAVSRPRLGAQRIIDPGNTPGEDAMGFFYARLRTSF